MQDMIERLEDELKSAVGSTLMKFQKEHLLTPKQMVRLIGRVKHEMLPKGGFDDD